MPNQDGQRRFSRRQVMVGAGALAGAAAVGSGAPAGASPPSRVKWPTERLGNREARSVDASQFLPVAQLRQWHEELDALGMRATGSPAHEHYIDVLIARLKAVGVSRVRQQPVPLEKWTAQRWSLELVGRPGDGPVATASYIPYSGRTSPGGISGPLAYVETGRTPPAGSLSGKIALFEVPSAPVTYGTMEEIAYGRYDPRGLLVPTEEYSRPWGGVSDLITLLDSLPATGAIGCVAVIDLPAAGARGSYFPYDGIIRHVPGLFVDDAVGSRLRALASSEATVRLTLTASVERFVSRNVTGLIPGASDERVILNSHTDGPNAVEDNGPNTIVAICQYLCRLPKESLPRSIMVSYTTGHFHGGIGQVSFSERYKDSTPSRVACAMTLEHLGSLEWNEDAEGQMALTGKPELGVVFVPENKAMVQASLAALQRADAGPALVLRPYVSAPGSPNGYGWPGEGTQLWSDGHVMTMNYITGPTYLLNWGMPTLPKCDIARMRREALSFTQMALDLGRVPHASLSSLDLAPL